MRMRVALAVALLCVVVVFAIEMSGSAPRLSGTDHIDPRSFVVILPPKSSVCQPIASLPGDTGSVKLLVGTYGRPLPAISAKFVGPRGAEVTGGQLPAGGRQGYVSIPLRHPHGPSVSGTLCFHFDSEHNVAVAGEPLAASATSASVNGQPQPAGLAFYYLRPGSESWWELLPLLTQRFGFGKAAFFGEWTLPAAALLLLGIWTATIRLLCKEAI